ncbi:MAG: class I SAM-dependent methyltransferase [Alphaproteobacteria bacterium]
MQRYEDWENGAPGNHAGQAFPTSILARLEDLLPKSMSRTAETGCGKSTILFSNISSSHTVFALDDRNLSDSSVAFYTDCPISKLDAVKSVFGPTQRTLRSFVHEGDYDCVLIDGPHGWPFPEFEYLMFYPYIRPGGFLLLDDCVIPTIGRMADVIAEDPMWTLVEIVGSTTAVFMRTDVESFDPEGDGWWEQPFNRKRVSSKRSIWMKDDAGTTDVISSLGLDRILQGRSKRAARWLRRQWRR